MKPVAWIKIRELSYMKAVAEHGKDDWQTNLGLKPEPDDEGLYTETQVQRMIELLKRCVEAIGLVLATLNLDDVYPAQRELLREALRAAKQSQDTTCPDCERHKASASMWRNEAYKHAGTPLPWEPEELLRKEYERGYADAMGWKLQNHLEHLPGREKNA